MSTLLNASTWPAPRARLEIEERARDSAGEVVTRARIVVTVDIPELCHIQSNTPSEPFLIPTTVEVDEIDGVTVHPAIYPAGETERYDWSSVVLDVYRGAVDIVVPLEISAATCADGAAIAGRVRYQGCTATTCLPPSEWPFEVGSR
jgi:DsbC/DsbD-like thiol-disulfide interchange protein